MSRETSEEVPGIVYEKSKNPNTVTNETHVQIRIVSPIEFSVDLSSGEKKIAP